MAHNEPPSMAGMPWTDGGIYLEGKGTRESLHQRPFLELHMKDSNGVNYGNLEVLFYRVICLMISEG